MQFSKDISNYLKTICTKSMYIETNSKKAKLEDASFAKNGTQGNVVIITITITIIIIIIIIIIITIIMIIEGVLLIPLLITMIVIL
jgi:hypothetical protein